MSKLPAEVYLDQSRMGVVQRFLPVAAEAEQYMRKHGRQCLAENGINRLTMDAACRVTAQCPVVTNDHSPRRVPTDLAAVSFVS